MYSETARRPEELVRLRRYRASPDNLYILATMEYSNRGTQLRLRALRMVRPGIIAIVLLIVLFPVLGQDQSGDVLQAYQRNFIRGNLATKIQVLQGAANEKDAEMGALYHQALKFVVDNVEFFKGDDAAFRELALLSVRLIGLSGYQDAVTTMWDLFTLDDTRSVRVAILNTLGTLEPTDGRLVANLNNWLAAQNEAFKDGRSVDVKVIEEAVVALGNMGDDSSFPVLFSVSILGYGENVVEKARTALYKIEGDFKELILRVIEQNQLPEKLEALRIAQDNESLSGPDKAEIAAASLEKGLHAPATDDEDREYLRQLRFESVRVLTAYEWSAAAENVILHFDRTLQEYTLKIGRMNNVIEAIEALGSMGTHKAAERLSVYLDVLNSRKEGEKDVEEEIVLAVIQNLGELGDSVAFDCLLYAQFLDYSEKIRRAARDAANKL